MPLRRWITYSAFCLASVQVIFLWNLFPQHPLAADQWHIAEESAAAGDQSRMVRAHRPSRPPGPYEYSQPGAAQDYLMQNE